MNRRALPPGHVAIALSALLGTIASVVAGVFVLSWEYRVADLEFRNLAQSYVQIIKGDLADETTLLYTIGAFLDSRDHPIAQPEFERFSRALHDRVVGLRDIGWAPHIMRAERAGFERAARLSGPHYSQIWRRGAHGKRVVDSDRAEYYPVQYVEPGNVKKQVAGLDLLTEPSRRRAIIAALRMEQPAATTPIKLISVKESSRGMMAFMPVTNRSRGRSKHIKGVVFGVFEIAPMVENIIEKKIGRTGLDVYLFNPAAAAPSRFIFWRSNRARSGGPPSEADLLALPHWQGQVVMIDQHWTAIVTSGEPVGLFQWSWRAMTTLATGLTMTGMIVAYLIISLRRRAELEALTASLHQSGKKLAEMARHDALTGLPNRLLLLERLNQAIAGFDEGAPFAILFLDLDRFKAVNDTFGHATGDRLLCAVAKRIAGCLRDVDLIARLGGDEFAVILTDATYAPAIESIAGRLIADVSRAYVIDGYTVTIGVSIGATIVTAKTLSGDILLKEADFALYHAKGAGRGVFRFFDLGLYASATEPQATPRPAVPLHR